MKKSIAPFKMIPASLRDRLHELTGSELKVWLAVVLHSDANREAFPSNGVLMEETGLTHTTLAKAKQGLRSKKWFTSAQRYRENGSLSSMGEKWHIPVTCSWYIPEFQGDTCLIFRDISLRFSGIAYPRLVGGPEVDTLEVDTGKPDTSKPQDQNLLVSKSVSQASFASLTTSERREEQKPVHGSLARTKPDDSLWDRDQEQAWLAQERIPFWSEELNRGLDIEEVIIAEELYLDLIRKGKMDEADVVTLYELALAYQTDDTYGQAVIRSIWQWNKLHKKDSLQFRTIQALAKAMRSESDNNVVIQWHEHNRAECPKCKKLRKCVRCRLVEDCVNAEEFLQGEWRGEYLHKHCSSSWHEKQCRPVEMPPMQLKPEPVGEGLEYERSEQKGDCTRCMGFGRTVCTCENDPDDIDLTPDNEYAFFAKGGLEVEERE